METKNHSKEGDNKISKKFFFESMRTIFYSPNPEMESVYEKIFQRFKVQNCEIKHTTKNDEKNFGMLIKYY